MPLDEEGAKWSCEPCIRGHRSSKCQHFDRLMMKVPKAGRPLAKCPHPKGSCSCQKTYAVMVRIPKGSSCLCRPLYKVPMEANESTQSPPSSMASTSSPAGKVQKSGRRQSTMQAAPGNIARALESMKDNVKIEDGAPNLFSDFPSQSGLDGSHSSSIASMRNQATSSSAEHTGKTPQSPQASSCCSQKPNASTPAVAPVPAQNEGSCCGGSRPPKTDQAVHPEDDKQNLQQPDAWDDQTYTQFSPWQNSMISTQEHYIHPTLPQAHSQPSLFHSGYMDMLPPQHQASMSQNGDPSNLTSPPSLGYLNSVNGLGITDPSMDPYIPNNPESFHIASPNGDPCHDCSCGEDCQCLGCAAHPFNTTTRKHVQEMGAMITSNGDEKIPEAFNPYQVSPYQASTPSTPFPYFMQHTPSMDHGFQPIPFDSYSDPNSTLPSGYSSPLSSNHHLNQQLMHPSEYYTLEYPVGLPSACSDVTGSCQCGSDCSCVGCLTHSGHNGLPLDVPIPEQTINDTANQQNQMSRPDSRTSSATSPLSRIPVLDNMSVPCLSPRTLETSMI